MKNFNLMIVAFMLFGFVGKAQHASADDLCEVTFGDGRTYYAQVISQDGNIIYAKILRTGSLYAFNNRTVKESSGAYETGHVCQNIRYYRPSVNNKWRPGDFLYITFGDGNSYYAKVTSVFNNDQAYSVKFLHSGSNYEFDLNGKILSSTGAYDAGQQTRSVELLVPWF